MLCKKAEGPTAARLLLQFADWKNPERDGESDGAGGCSVRLLLYETNALSCYTELQNV